MTEPVTSSELGRGINVVFSNDHAGGRTKPVELVDCSCVCGFVEPGAGLVEEKESRMPQRRSRNFHATALSRRQVFGRAVFEIF